MEIIRATVDHALAIAEVHVQSWKVAYSGIIAQEFLDGLAVADRADRWKEVFRLDESHTFVALIERQVVGFVSLGKCRDEGSEQTDGEIWALYAAPKFWGCGVGYALTAKAVQELSGLGYSRVSLWVLSLNRRAIDFYRRFGFLPVPGSEKVFELGGSHVQETRFVRENGA